jgi:ketosteroid isomerase-like protein
MTKRKSGIYGLLLLSLFCAGCATTSLAHQSADNESAVREAMARFMDALNGLDVARMDAAFTDDVTAFVPLAQPDEAVGRAAVTQIFRTFADRARATTPRLNLVPEEEHIEASPTLAVVTFQIHETSPRMTRRRTFVFRRVGNSWLISHFHASDFVSPGR